MAVALRKCRVRKMNTLYMSPSFKIKLLALLFPIFPASGPRPILNYCNSKCITRFAIMKAESLILTCSCPSLHGGNENCCQHSAPSGGWLLLWSAREVTPDGKGKEKGFSVVFSRSLKNTET